MTGRERYLRLPQSLEILSLMAFCLVCVFLTGGLSAAMLKINAIEITVGKAVSTMEARINRQDELLKMAQIEAAVKIAKKPKESVLSLQWQLGKMKSDLAYLHLLAYARNLKPESKLRTKAETGEIWTRHHLDVIFFQVEKPKDDLARHRSQTHLKQVLKLFKSANKHVKSVPPEVKNIYVRLNGQFKPLLGQAWCHMQLKELDKAKDLYRKAVKLAWAHDTRKGTMGYHGSATPLTQQAATQLLTLLDGKRDQVEIADLKKKIRYCEKEIDRYI